MTLAFHAKFVDCTEAIGGELLQVAFDTVPSDADEDARQTAYVSISRLFEFPGRATIEWHDGSDYEGGAEIVSLVLTRDRVLIKLDRDLDMDVGFSIGDRRFAKLSAYLRRMLDEGVFVSR